ANIELPQMLSGHLQGRFLSMMSKMLSPGVVVDIGTFTGYSAMCMAEGLADGGIVHTIDINQELAPMVDRYLRKAGLHEKVHQHLPPATEVITTIEAPVDLVFIDAAKGNYSTFLDPVIEKLHTVEIAVEYHAL